MITQELCSGARNRAAIWPASRPASEMWATPQRINAPFRFKKGQHRNLVFSWKQNWAVSEVQWARVTLSFPCPSVLFAYLFSSFSCFGTPGIVGSSRVRKQHCQNILRKEDCELFLAQAGAGSIWHLRVPGKLVLMRTELHPARSGGPDFRDLEKPLMAKHNGNYHVVLLRSPYLGSPWRRSQLTSWTPPRLCGGFWVPAPSGSLPLFSRSPRRHCTWDYFFSPLTKHIQMVRCLPQSRGSGG